MRMLALLQWVKIVRPEPQEFRPLATKLGLLKVLWYEKVAEEDGCKNDRDPAGPTVVPSFRLFMVDRFSFGEEGVTWVHNLHGCKLYMGEGALYNKAQPYM